MRHWPATLAVGALLAVALASTWLHRERVVEVIVSGQVAPFANLEGEPVEVSVSFPELNLKVMPDGRRRVLDANGKPKFEPLQSDPRNRFGAQVQPDGHYRVTVGFATRQVPTWCTLAFARPNQVTRRLRQIHLQGQPEHLTGSASDERAYRPRRTGSDG